MVIDAFGVNAGLGSSSSNGFSGETEKGGGVNAQRDPFLTLRVLNILEFFIQQAPLIEDVNQTAKGPLPDLSEKTKIRIKRRAP